MRRWGDSEMGRLGDGATRRWRDAGTRRRREFTSLAQLLILCLASCRVPYLRIAPSPRPPSPRPRFTLSRFARSPVPLYYYLSPKLLLRPVQQDEDNVGARAHDPFSPSVHCCS